MFENSRPEFLHGPIMRNSQCPADKENVKPAMKAPDNQSMNVFATPKRQPETPIKPTTVTARRYVHLNIIT